MVGPGKLLKERTNTYGASAAQLAAIPSTKLIPQNQTAPKPLFQSPSTINKTINYSDQKAMVHNNKVLKDFWYLNSPDPTQQDQQKPQPLVLSERKPRLTYDHTNGVSPILSEGFADLQNKVGFLQQSDRSRTINFNDPDHGELSIKIFDLDMNQVKDLSVGIYNKLRNYVKSKTRGQSIDNNNGTLVQKPLQQPLGPQFSLNDQQVSLRNKKLLTPQLSVQQNLPNIASLGGEEAQSIDSGRNPNSLQISQGSATSCEGRKSSENAQLHSGRQSILDTMKNKIQSMIQFPNGLFNMSPRNSEQKSPIHNGVPNNEFSFNINKRNLTQRKSQDNTVVVKDMSQPGKTLLGRQDMGFLEYYQLQKNGSHTSKNSQQPEFKKRNQSYTETFSNLQDTKSQIDTKLEQKQRIEEIVQVYGDLLTQFEKQEILKYSEVFYIGTAQSKEQRKFKQILLHKDNNNGFDRQGGFYKVVVGDHLAYRYEVLQELDRGAFGQVLRCIDHKQGGEVAVKINKNMATHHNTCRAEAAIMQRMRDLVPDDEDMITSLRIYKDRVVRYRDHFLFRNHYVITYILMIQCFVFELLGSNLFSDMKDQKFISFNIKQKIRPIAYQLVQGLNYLKHCQVIHCDLKPENIMYTDSRRKDIKIIDFGSASSFGMNTFTYVQSRFYRAPEVVLGITYDYQVDIWSLGCIIAELYCGRPLFPGLDENELLEFHILMCGNPPQQMIDKSKKKAKFFNNYRIIRSPNSRLTTLSKNSASLYHAIFSERFPESMRNNEIHDKLNNDERQMVDFIKRCLQIDPNQRLTCEEAIRHDWFKDLLIETEKDIEKRIEEINFQALSSIEIKRHSKISGLHSSPHYEEQSPENVFHFRDEDDFNESKFSHINNNEPGFGRNNFKLINLLQDISVSPQKKCEEQNQIGRSGTQKQPVLQRFGSTATTQNSSGPASKNRY